MSLLYLVAGDKGQPIDLEFIDVDTGELTNISSYDETIQMIFIKPDKSIATKTAVFKTDGIDGVIRYVVEAAFLVIGDWQVRGRVASGSATLTTVWHHFKVIA